MSDLIPYLCVADARAAIDWYTTVFEAQVSYEPIIMEDGRVGHVELTIGDSRLMMSDEFESAGVAAPDPARGAAVTLHLQVADVDAVVTRAVAGGARLDRGPEDSDHGRVAVFRDPSGHRWMTNAT